LHWLKPVARPFLWRLAMSKNQYQSFITDFNEIARHKHRYDVFRDFVTLSALSLHNTINKIDSLEP
jgi:hypothetical protein